MSVVHCGFLVGSSGGGRSYHAGGLQRHLFLTVFNNEGKKKKD